MILHAHLLLPALMSLGAQPSAPAVELPSIYALRARTVETASQGTLEYAVILVENGKIVVVGEDLPIERGIPVYDLPDDWVVMPGLVNCYSRIGLDGRAGSESQAHVMASDVLYPRSSAYKDVLEAGVTTLALYPAGTGVPGQAVVIQPKGATREQMILKDSAYLKLVLQASSGSKRMIEKGFQGVEKYEGKVEKAREKWEKAQEKKKKKGKKKSKKKDDDKESSDGDKESKSKKSKDDEVFTPPAPDEKELPWVELDAGRLRGLFSISGAAEYLHLLDVLGDREFDWHLRVPVTLESDIFYVETKDEYGLDVDGIGDRGCFVVMEPTLSLHPGTMRQRNLPAELSGAGANICFIPRNDRVHDHERWLMDVGDLIATGMDRQEAIKALTSNPAEFLGMGEELGSIEAGRRADLLIFSGDPFEPGTELKAVVLFGELAHGDLNQ